MTRYSVQPRDRIFVKSYGVLSFARSINKNTSKNLKSNCSQKLDHAIQSATHAIKIASQRTIQETAQTANDLIGKKIANESTESQTFTTE